jgi:hypothetical protein
MNKIGYSLISVSAESIYNTISKNVGPIILYSVHKNHSNNLITIKDIYSYLQNLNIEIPTVILTKIIYELKEDFQYIKDDYFECQKDLSEIDYDAYWLSEMIQNFEAYAKENNYTVQKDYFFDLVQFISIFAENILLDRELNYVDRKNKVFFLNFIKELKENSSEKEKFEKLLKAILMFSFVKNFDEKTVAKQYKKVNYILDSNIIFALLDFQKEYFVKTSNEMISLLKNQDIQLCILDITVDEVKKLFQAYVARFDELNKNTNLIQDSSVFHFLYYKGYNRERTLELIDGIDIFLRKKGIKELSTSPYRKYFLSDLDENDKLQSDIYFSNLYSARTAKKINSAGSDSKDFLDFEINIDGIIHDANVVKSVKGLNASLPHDKVFDVAYTFITRDKTFFHTFQNSQKPEVVLSDTITLFYWLSRSEDQKIDDGYIPYDEILSFYSSKTEILDDVWERFLYELNQQDVDEIYKKKALFYKINESDNVLDVLKEKSTSSELSLEDVNAVVAKLIEDKEEVKQLKEIHAKSQEKINEINTNLENEKKEKKLLEKKLSISQEMNEISTKNEEYKREIDILKKNIAIKEDSLFYKHNKKIYFSIFVLFLFIWWFNNDIKTAGVITALIGLIINLYGGKKKKEIKDNICEINLQIEKQNILIEENKAKKLALETHLKHGVDE